jgi:cytochrome d ubiquinol oxidase subunit II
MIILFSFVLQAVSYEFQNKLGNLLGAKTFQVFLVINGILGPVLLGGAVATFFMGSNFVVDKTNIMQMAQPVISRWANASHGLDALLDIWNVVFGLAVFFLARVLGTLYIINNVNDEIIRSRARVQLIGNTVMFLLLFLAFLFKVILGYGYAYDDNGTISIVDHKYLNNLIDMWYLTVIILIGVVLLLYGIIKTIMNKTYIRGIWPAGIGVVLVVLCLLLCAGWNHTAYYPSNEDLQSSLTIANSCSSEFTLRTMAYVSIFIPFVLAYIVYAWRAIDKKEIDKEEIAQGDAY